MVLVLFLYCSFVPDRPVTPVRPPCFGESSRVSISQSSPSLRSQGGEEEQGNCGVGRTGLIFELTIVS
jgi:hypothetical protein